MQLQQLNKMNKLVSKKSNFELNHNNLNVIFRVNLKSYSNSYTFNNYILKSHKTKRNRGPDNL